ncbi:MAG: cobalamin biosynthesis protein P47K [Bryobacterales bacterium]|nr:cobalamin biosynthesis protein P47K [Bryobacterales bacterium]
MIGGFLGAGKTTALLALAKRCREAGVRPGLITNDQSFGLVDTAMLASNGFDVEEIGGGCFCCRFNSLVEAAANLSRAERPGVFLAEPVGSCTDLRAAVSYPLRQIYGDDFDVAPLSVLVDPLRAERMLGLAEGRNFAPKVQYVYSKQLEEADAVVINKIDLLDPARLDRLRQALSVRYPQARIFAVSVRTAVGLDEWFHYLTTAAIGLQPSPDVDYEIYAEGEALLGWLNCTAAISAPHEFDGHRLLQNLAATLRRSANLTEIAHLKMTLSPEQGHDIAVVNLVRSDGAVEFSHRLQEKLSVGELIVNLRAEGDPEEMWLRFQEALNGAAGELGVSARIEQHEHFRPAKPNPTHRLATV